MRNAAKTKERSAKELVHLSSALGVLLSVLLLSLGDLMEIIPFFAPLVAASPFHFFHEIHDLLAGAVAFYAAYRYHTRLGVIAILLFLAAHIPYAIIQSSEDAPELVRILVTGLATLFAVWLLDRLHKAEELHQILATSSPIGVYIIQDGMFLFVNPQFLKDTDYTEEELLGSQSSRLIHPEDMELAQQNAIAMLQGQRSTPYQYRVIRKTGDIVWIMDSVASISYRGRRATLGHFMNVTESQQMKEMLRLSEEEYRNLVDNALIGVFRTNLKGDIRYLNDTAVSMFGFDSAAEMISGGVLVRYKNPSDRAILLKKLTEKGKVNSFEVELLTKTGEVKNVIMNVLLEGDTISGTLVDITERKRAEQALLESEHLYHSLFEHMLNGFAYCRMLFDQGKPVDFIYLSVNSAFEALTELKNVVGKKVSEVIPGIQKSNPELFEIYGRVALTGIPESFETYLPALKMWFSISAYSPEKEYFVAVFDVITERKKTEEQLRIAEENFRNSLDNFPLGIRIITADGELLYANKAMLDIYGYSSVEELSTTPRKERYTPGSYAESQKRWELRKQGKPVPSNYEISIVRKDGEISHLSVSRKEVTWNGKMQFQAVYQDITEHKKMDEQLMTQDRLASIGELASGIAHELNNPLTSVIGFSELLSEKKDLPADIKEDLEVINREAKRTAGVVRNLLTFARKHPQTKQLVDISNIIETVLALRTYEQRINNIQVNTRFAPDLPEVMADGFQLQQVFLNIVINAEFFMIEAHGRGTLTITTERVGDIIRASLSDDGPGIPKEYLEHHLFNPFSTTKEVGKGTGLGLSICHGIVTAHGGRIYAESELGKGATFVVELPIASKMAGKEQ